MALNFEAPEIPGAFSPLQNERKHHVGRLMWFAGTENRTQSCQLPLSWTVYQSISPLFAQPKQLLADPKLWSLQVFSDLLLSNNALLVDCRNQVASQGDCLRCCLCSNISRPRENTWSTWSTRGEHMWWCACSQAQGTTIPASFLCTVCQTLLFLSGFLPEDRTEVMEE